MIPGHAYSIIRVVNYQGHQLLNIRNPWGTYEWEGAWSDSDKSRWTDDAISEIKPVFGDDGTFWMSYQDFLSHFSTLNVCKVRDWEEIRVKCEFSNFGTKASSLRSKYVYELTVTAKQSIVITVHQEDERI